MNIDDYRRVVKFERSDKDKDKDHKDFACGLITRTCRAIADHPGHYVPDGFLLDASEVVIRIPMHAGADPIVESNFKSLVIEG